jgi:penicillin-binding protein 1B
VVVTEPRTGAILALVGGREYRDSQFNRAVQARRQPGSCFKPFVYLAGFEAAAERGPSSGLTPSTILEDEPLELVSGGRKWRPENYDGQFRGKVTARRALEASLNVPTVRAAQHVGLRSVAAAAGRCGISTELKPLPSLALGAQEVSPLDLATAYGTIAQLGRRVAPDIIRAVVGADGKAISLREVRAEQVASPAAAYLVTDVLRGVFARGTAASAADLGFRGDAAGKTGTTDDTRDAWFAGYTPEILALVWVGYDDNAKTGLTGASGALPIWVDFMMRSRGRWGFTSFPIPDGVVREEIDPETGMLATRGCPSRNEELFIAGTEPDECSIHGGGLFRWFRRLFRGDDRPPPTPPV